MEGFLYSGRFSLQIWLTNSFRTDLTSSFGKFLNTDTSWEELKDFETFVDKVYLPFARENHSSVAHDEFRCEALKEQFKGKRFQEITMMMVVKFINQRLTSDTVRREVRDDGTVVSKKRSPTTVNKEVTLLSSIFRMAMREKVATANPCDELPKSVRAKIPARRRRNRRLSQAEESALFKVGCRET